MAQGVCKKRGTPECQENMKNRTGCWNHCPDNPVVQMKFLCRYQDHQR